MPAFELIGLALESPALAKVMPAILNTNYSSILGDNINFVIGGGRINNMYGTDTKLVMDWEELITQKFFPSQMTTVSHNVINSKTYGMFMGIGGDATLVFGNRSSFLYYGESLNVSRIPHPAINISSPSTKDPVLIKQLLEAGILEANTQTVPPQIQLCLATGSLALLAASLLMRFYNGLNGIYSSAKVAASENETQEIILAAGCMLISGLETRWLYLLKWLEANTSIIIQQALNNLNDLQKKVAQATKVVDAAIARNVQAQEQYAANLAQEVPTVTAEAAMVRNAQIIEETSQSIADYMAKKEAVMATLANLAWTYGLTPGGGTANTIKAPVTPVVSQKAKYQSYELAVNDYTLNALTGDVNIKASAPAKSVNLNAQSVNLSANIPPAPDSPMPQGNPDSQAILSLNQGPAAGAILLETAGTTPAIFLNANLLPNPAGLAANIQINAAGIAITYGPPEAQGVVSLTTGEVKVAIGPAETGSSILLTPASIVLQAGETVMTISPDGVFTYTPSTMVTTVGDTLVSITSEGINEAVGEVTREVNAEGHTLTAAEVLLQVGVEGVVTSAPTGTSEFDGSGETIATMLDLTSDGTAAVEAPLFTVE